MGAGGLLYHKNMKECTEWRGRFKSGHLSPLLQMLKFFLSILKIKTNINITYTLCMAWLLLSLQQFISSLSPFISMFQSDLLVFFYRCLLATGPFHIFLHLPRCFPTHTTSSTSSHLLILQTKAQATLLK